ncbi:autotransporter outer membrane beta-barrel domain-containing protein [Castellaniella sp.]|uniref:autotransporter outer membrane beta-barrel domain-containing protein n=1 Tax=Castellaniella sp. TaxID=1955812 RepID=UPI002AFF86C7|nr:autotransporter outer membrane beta-barrel domain-containing protein [Castellaniella sp.]
MKKTWFQAGALLCALYGYTAGAQAGESQVVARADGTPVFDVRFFGPQDGGFWFGDWEGASRTSTWPLSVDQKANILQAAQYWASVIRPVPGGTVGVLNIGTFDGEGAFGASLPLGNGTAFKVPLQIALQGEALSAAQLPYGTHGIFTMGLMDWTPGVDRQSQIGDRDGLNMTAVAVHEFAHTLGVMTTSAQGSPNQFFFGDEFTTWSTYLVDDNGRAGHAGQEILCAACANTDPAGFDVRQNQGRFVGPHVLEALEGGLSGIPVTMMRQDPLGNESLDADTMSHMELKNSLMSHQKYRNHTRLMEAELAVLQDLGYGLDRRDFFGRSVYGSGLDVVNTRGYFARNTEGTAYLDGQYNQTTLGMGLHVYGSHNRIRQAADLLSLGAGGAGVRIDGEGNQLTIDPGVRVHAQGDNGQGVMLVYGRHHQLAVRGDVQALGAQGVGLRFDFGHNLGSGDSVEYRGSYIRTSADGPLPMLEELNGALADRVDISGTVAGSQAALYMSESALVGQINILQGAQIQGDIVSDYAQRDAQGRWRLTTVTFGQQADGAGWATGQADADFDWAYAGNMKGRDNLNLSFDGGRTRLDGHHVVQGAVIQPGAWLSGNATYDLADGSFFLNQGGLTPGVLPERAQIVGDYRQGSSGMLLSAFSNTGLVNPLSVKGTAQLAGTLGLQALPDWYADGWTSNAQPVQADALTGAFGQVDLVSVSPTLSFAADALGIGQYRLGVTRPVDAYSQYGRDANDRRVGQALSQWAARGAADAQDLFTQLDFSRPDGQDVEQALSQLSPAAYSAALAASLRRDRLALDTALGGLSGPDIQKNNADHTQARASSWSGHASLFGGTGRQDAQGDLVASRDTLYGVVAGASRWLESAPAVQLGVALDVSEQTSDLRESWAGQAKSTALGISGQWRYQPDVWTGPYALGGVRLGLEHGRLTRNLGFAAYSASHDARWTGYQAGVQVAGGWQYALAASASVGPYWSLDYNRLSRPAVDESGPQATRLQLDRQHADALRTRLGVTARAAWDIADGGVVSAHARATWDREWLAQDVRQGARFAAQPSVDLDSVNDLASANLLGLRAGVAWQRDDRLSVALDIGSQLGSGYRAVDGQVRIQWAF